MNKTALFIGLGIVLTSCNLFTDPVRKSAEAYLMENLNDPSSYEFVSLVPTDTITYLDNIDGRMELFQSSLMFDSTIVAGIDSIKTALGSGVNEVACYEYAFTYRAKNATGALTLIKATLQITPENEVIIVAETPGKKILYPNSFPGYMELILKKYQEQ